jgi:DNA replication protein DnaC
MDNIIQSLSESVPHPDSEYLGEDGLLHCSVCHAKVQTEVEFLGVKRTVRCICLCRQAAIEAEKNRERQEERERRRMICFAGTDMKGWCFDNDDQSRPKLSAAMKRYADNFPEYRRTGKGLLLHGTVGTGKTFCAACIANRIIDNGFSALMTNFPRLINTLQGMYDGKQEYIDSLNKYSLLILDDLGVERGTEYMQEMVFNIIDARYRSGLPFIVTTNLTPAQLMEPQDVAYKRIYDRILERCFPVEVNGASRRTQSMQSTYGIMKGELGL